MTDGMQAIIFPSSDLARTKSIVATLLNADPVMDQPYYVQFSAGGVDIGIDPNGHAQGMTGPVGYWTVDDIEASISALVDAGATSHQAPKDVGGGKLVATVRDADGNTIGLVQPA